MDDGVGKLNIVPDHFHVSTSDKSTPDNTPSTPHPRPDSQVRSRSRFWTGGFKGASFMLNLFSLRALPWGSSSTGEEKVELTVVELEALQSELADLEEREAHLKAQLENVSEILRSARFSGYLYIRTRWTALPGEPPPLDDCEVDDWLPRFVVLHGPCIFFYLSCSDLSPQDSTLLSDIVEVGSLPSFTREDDETNYCFYILTRQGLRYECSSSFKIQVDTWLTALRADCKLGSDAKSPDGSSEV